MGSGWSSWSLRWVGKKNNTSETCLRPPLPPPLLISKKRVRLFSALELPPNQILNYLFRN
jgi:hypothetical protein